MTDGTDLPACGQCGVDLDSREEAINHLHDEHGFSGPAVLSAVNNFDWSDQPATDQEGSR